jgi:hypothetical protein
MAELWRDGSQAATFGVTSRPGCEDGKNASRPAGPAVTAHGTRPGSVIPPVWAVALAEQARAEVAERVGEQPADVHLGDAELLADLGLGHAAAEAQEQDLLLALGQAHPRAWRGPAS